MSSIAAEGRTSSLQERQHAAARLRALAAAADVIESRLPDEDEDDQPTDPLYKARINERLAALRDAVDAGGMHS